MLTKPGLLGGEKTQQDIVNTLSPQIEMDSLIVKNLPGLLDIRKANEDEKHAPDILSSATVLAEFIKQTLKQRRRIDTYEFSTVAEEHIKWSRTATPKNFARWEFKDISAALAKLMMDAQNCVAVRVSLGKGIELGGYIGKSDEFSYDPYVKYIYLSKK